jgi:Domain of unknown function (DUF4598)
MSSPKRLKVLPRGPAATGAASKTQNIQLGELDMLSEDRDSSSDLEEFSEAISDSTSSSGDSELESSSDGETLADSEDEEHGEDGETPIDLVATQSKIKMSPTPTNLRLRLSKFLPELQQANIHLEEAGNALVSQLDDVADDEEHYIEMNLGLGVLEEVRMGDNTVAIEDSSSSADAETSEEEDVMEILKGQTRTRPVKRKIEEIS